MDPAIPGAVMSSSPADPARDVSSSEALMDGGKVHGTPRRGEDLVESLAISL